MSDVPSRVPDLAAAPDRHRVPNPSQPLQLHPGTNSTPPNVPNTANPACGCTFGPLPAGAASSNFTALGHHLHGQGAQISIAHACAQDCRSQTCPTPASSNPPVRALSHQRDPPKTEFFQIGPNSNQSHSVPRDISTTTRCPAGRGALGLTSVQNSGPRVTPSGSDALSTDGYRKRITFSDVVKGAQTVPVAPNGAQTPCAQLFSAQRTRAQAKPLCAQTPSARKKSKKSKKVKFSKFRPLCAQPYQTPPAVAPSASQRENAKGEVIAELTRQSLAHCDQLGATATGPKYFVKATILGNPVTMLVDSGSQVNILPASHCPRSVLDSLSPPPTLVPAYNGSAVRIAGTFETDIDIGGLRVVRSPIYVTSDTLRPILGTPALAPLTIDFRAGTISDGTALFLTACPAAT